LRSRRALDVTVRPPKLLVVVVAAGLMAGCSTSSQDVGDRGYVSGNGTVMTIAAADRESAPEVSGTALDGRPLAIADYPGQVIVLNVWGSWCAECREERADLEAAWRQLSRQGVQFIGIDTRDNLASARSYVRAAGITYPSIFDTDGQTLLGFRGTVSPAAIPSTVVLDAQHRVAARVLGPITKTTLIELVRDLADQT
jgi:peroxiredoxin